ncbi:outer membrane protein 8 [Anaplasma marginale str. St. Maries]|uniref:OMP8 n=1 Tax=Anaplasma marginale (strain St. Maries) TaxID=234826 RepID=Q5P9J1_ANAMM|nr:P44/Msp2 family outer membrane protein [Anaplasma marginale]AAV87039.1 outer membrane protein 8 [Anaplasma marginale str. St. Maries]ABB86366.1 OMP8 [Anaplasma marginale str. St. Maries]ABB86367.1 OMP8 [Anaplasma marginale str. St. Maries]ABB86368.1 OMP8 [Anaplasma marginale str. St. Maries]ABB86369.1 OMP8 [Anaplasma marginale str. St. Maries]
MVRSFLLSAVVVGAIAFGSSAVAAGFGGDDTDFYLGFGLAPAFGNVADFYAEVPGAADSALPYRKDAIGGGETSPFDFDWEESGTKGSKYPIKFQHNSLFGVVGSIGVRHSTGRLEFEAMRERFPIMKVSGRVWAKGDSMFLLVDDAVVRVATGQRGVNDSDSKTVKSLSKALPEHRDFLSLEDALLTARQDFMVQKGTLSYTGASTDDAAAAAKIVAMAYGRQFGKVDLTPERRRKAMLLLAAATAVGEEEREIVKRAHMIRAAFGSIGGHKIEIPAVAANTFGANYCYDVSTVNMGGLSPYGCVSAGMSFLKVVKNSVPKFTYGAKLGVSYELSPRARVFVGGAYRRVMGYGERCRVSTLSAASGYREYTERENIRARVSFGLHYLALEAGLRFILA